MDVEWMRSRIEELEAWQVRARADMERMADAIVALSGARPAPQLTPAQQHASEMLALLIEACDTFDCAVGYFSATFHERAERAVHAAGGMTQLDLRNYEVTR